MRGEPFLCLGGHGVLLLELPCHFRGRASDALLLLVLLEPLLVGGLHALLVNDVDGGLVLHSVVLGVELEQVVELKLDVLPLGLVYGHLSELAKLLFPRATELVDLFPLDNEDKGGHAPDTVPTRDLVLTVHINLGENCPTLILLRKLLKGRSDHPTRSAGVRVEIKDHRKASLGRMLLQQFVELRCITNSSYYRAGPC